VLRALTGDWIPYNLICSPPYKIALKLENFKLLHSELSKALRGYS
jgi:hypothetical protein